MTMRSWRLGVVMSVGLAVLAPVAGAEDAETKASSAVANILFEYDGSDFASYAVREDGFVDILFARNTPDKLYGEMIDKLRAHPDIKGVLPGKTGPVCSSFN